MNHCFFQHKKSHFLSCFYPIFDNTLERIIYNILQKKKNVIDTVMGDITIEPGTDIMQELFNELHNI